MVGVPGSGKTTLARKLVEKGFHYMNADSIRMELYGNEAEQGDKEQVFELFFQRLEEVMQLGNDIVVDNTNINMRQRKPILDRALQFQYIDVQLWLLDVPLEICLARNAARERVVPDDIVANMFMELNRSGRPKNVEGRLVIIRPGKDENDFRFFFPGVKS
jgi:predicted kinase